MDLYSFVRNSTVVDLAFVMLTLLAGFGVLVAAIVVAIKAKTRKSICILLGIALLPLLIALAGGAYRYYRSEQLLTYYSEGTDLVRDEYHRVFRAEFVTMCLLGAAGTVLPLLIGITALFVKKPQPESSVDPSN